MTASPLAGGPSSPARRNDADLRKLIVGREITLSGEINSCDRLIIEGSVEANLQNCTEVELAETGLFKGSATIDEIEVRGRFDGNLTVRKRLLIRATGRVFTVEENPRLCGWGAEIASIVAEEAFYDLDGPIVRVTAPDTPIPFSPPLERAILPQADDVKEACRELLAY